MSATPRFSREHRQLARTFLAERQSLLESGSEMAAGMDDVAWLAVRFNYTKAKAAQLLAAVRNTRPYTYDYRPRTESRRTYNLKNIPPTLWAKAEAQARREGISMRALLLQLVEQWLAEAGSRKEAV